MTRLDPKLRKVYILDACLRMARLHGYRNMTREDIALAAECSEGLVSSYLGTMTQVRRAVVRHAIFCKDLTVLAQAIAANDPHAMKAPDHLRDAAVQSLLKK